MGMERKKKKKTMRRKKLSHFKGPLQLLTQEVRVHSITFGKDEGGGGQKMSVFSTLSV